LKAFSGKVNMPTRKIFNYYCMSRAQWMIESVFGIIVERFVVLQKPISLIDLTGVRHIVMPCIISCASRFRISIHHSSVWTMRILKLGMLCLVIAAINLWIWKDDSGIFVLRMPNL
jgi:hypothetical protein